MYICNYCFKEFSIFFIYNLHLSKCNIQLNFHNKLIIQNDDIKNIQDQDDKENIQDQDYKENINDNDDKENIGEDDNKEDIGYDNKEDIKDDDKEEEDIEDDDKEEDINDKEILNVINECLNLLDNKLFHIDIKYKEMINYELLKTIKYKLKKINISKFKYFLSFPTNDFMIWITSLEVTNQDKMNSFYGIIDVIQNILLRNKFYSSGVFYKYSYGKNVKILIGKKILGTNDIILSYKWQYMNKKDIFKLINHFINIFKIEFINWYNNYYLNNINDININKLYNKYYKNIILVSENKIFKQIKNFIINKLS